MASSTKKQEDDNIIFPNLSAFYSNRGGETSRETAFGQISYEQVPITVRFVHDMRDVYALAPNGLVDLVGAVDADAPLEELLPWFCDDDWPLRSLEEVRARISEVNERFAFEEFRRGLPQAGPRAVCADCAKRAHRVYWGTALCDDCLCRRRGGP